MNNPFTSDRNIFNNINITRQQTNQPQSQPQNNNHQKTQKQPLNQPKTNLNFRADFRPTNPTSNNFTYNEGYSNSSSTSNLSEINKEDFQNRVIYDKQYPHYNNSNPTSSQLGGSSIPSMTIPSSSAHSGVTKPVQGTGPKITFGVADQSVERNLQYERGNFVNRQDFYTMSTHQKSNISEGTSSIRNPTQTQPPIHNYPQTNQSNRSTTPPKIKHNKEFTNLSMSPIQQKSKHIYDNSNQSMNSQFIGLDLNDGDLSKILANSKNQQELCKLLGIENPNGHSTNQNQRQYEQRSYQNIQPLSYKTSEPFVRKNSEPYNQGFSQVQPAQTQQLSSHPHNFIKKTSLPEPNINQYKFDDYHQTQQVFNYESQDYHYSETPHQASYNFNIQNTNPNINQKSNMNTKVIKSNQPNQPTFGNKQKDKDFSKQNDHSNELEMAIEQQMRKISMKGKIRTFLSASDKIDAVKYEMEYI